MSEPDRERHGTTVLVVDDDDVVRDVTARMLSDDGYRVLTAASGEDALAIAQALDGRLPVVVTDIRMPEMDGVELAAHLARLAQPPQVLFVSGYVPVTAPPGPLLAKPFLPDALLAAVRRLLGGGSTPAARPRQAR